MYTWFQPIISLLAEMLSVLDRVFQDWGLAIIVLTVLVKLALYRFQLTAARQQVRSAVMNPELKKLRDLHGQNPAELLQETNKLYQKHGYRPFAPFTGALLQLPILSAMYGLFLTHGSTMTSLLVPWVPHLAAADPFHLIPLITGMLSFALSLIPLTDIAAAPSMSMGQKVMIGILMMLIPLFVTWRAPIALGLYWISGTLFGLLERLFYRTTAGKRLLVKGMEERLLQ
ncbi:YidC/Oxa1 family membrane protein insertase [Paenibacillus sp. UNCCL117]|uniref:YidC/Oxa1 family membrane protein insertase n=1 Tax=unclassified Paenibacillus TaxID=185978 RepID=UPI000891C79C|nr:MULTISPECIES: YidC/Oxa1 family membrane protein insertase [unclassified Paenibacillus]SDD78004.1 YidC/Oxa1 family membrane protein insertase [Paenibacillus sp. cl123]SFW52873.1 YidC/Oxa1 family membrane protein insertase [Paenibacillus sp. UNCCL117]